MLLEATTANTPQYGVLVCIKCHNFGKSDVQLGLLLFFLIPCHFLVSYLIELVAAANARDQRAKTHKHPGRSSPTVDQSRKFERTWRTLRVAHCVNVIAVLAITTYVVYFHIHHPLIGTTAEVHALIVCLKTASYALTNRDLRHAYLHPVRGELDALPPIYKECPYPYNITFSNLIYFWAAPTLVYQPAYPRTERIRWGFVFKRVVEVVCLCAFIWFLSAQYAAPVLLNSLDKMHSLEYVAIFERLLKLSTISVGIWLAGFVGVFQSSMNALAEVTRFGDREFYEPWCMFPPPLDSLPSATHLT
jgi:diacylglycerol O-acyltransferase-1